MNLEILTSTVLQAQGFTANAQTLDVRVQKRVFVIDFHPSSALLYSEIDVARGYAYNGNFYVDPRHRHQGIGHRLVAAHEELCREAGLTILINNNRNSAFWKRQGYRRINPFWRTMLARRLGIELRLDAMVKRPE